ncbi:MAG TPA: hypothetical protein PLG47_05240 [Candidatus Dojkabacteria bacterium]|nr:hypothetical protein [Candidatus Dojkabacteria bacterium]
MRKRKTTKRRTTTKRKSTKKKPIGYTKVKGKFRLVYGTKKNPKLGSGSYSTKAKLASAARRALK